MATHANDILLGGKYAIQATSKDKSRWKVIDMGPENCCYSIYANDRVNQAEDNCKVELRIGRAIEEIFPGDGLTYAYGRDYWVANYKCLSKSARQHVCKYLLIKDECLWKGKIPNYLSTKKQTSMKIGDSKTANDNTRQKMRRKWYISLLQG